MDQFVSKRSIVREIWGKSDTILFIFAGSAAEFALNKSVDWLYFTGRLPIDPLGRLFSTVAYARAIVFSDEQSALKAIDTISKIHAGVEANRGAKIPESAYRDVLFMLIDYSIRAFEVLERKLTNAEKHEVFRVFQRVGAGMGLQGLPENFDSWINMRAEHIRENLERSNFTDDLFSRYKKHLGRLRYCILVEAQILVLPDKVRHLLGLRSFSLLQPLVWLYKVSKLLNADRLLKDLILPPKYKKEIMALDRLPG